MNRWSEFWSADAIQMNLSLMLSMVNLLVWQQLIKCRLKLQQWMYSIFFLLIGTMLYLVATYYFLFVYLRWRLFRQIHFIADSFKLAFLLCFSLNSFTIISNSNYNLQTNFHQLDVYVIFSPFCTQRSTIATLYPSYLFGSRRHWD